MISIFIKIKRNNSCRAYTRQTSALQTACRQIISNKLYWVKNGSVETIKQRKTRKIIETTSKPHLFDSLEILLGKVHLSDLNIKIIIMH